MKRLTIVLGTAREGRESEKVARVVTEAFKQAEDVEVTFVDVKDHLTVPSTIRHKDNPEAFVAWQGIAAQTDAFIFVIPEYHRGYPGEWKLLLDSLETEYRDKPAYIVGVSNGIFAGVRMGEHIKPVLVEMGFVLSRVGFFVGNVEAAFAEDGSLADEATKTRLAKFVTDVCSRL